MRVDYSLGEVCDSELSGILCIRKAGIVSEGKLVGGRGIREAGKCLDRQGEAAIYFFHFHHIEFLNVVLHFLFLLRFCSSDVLSSEYFLYAFCEFYGSTLFHRFSQNRNC